MGTTKSRRLATYSREKFRSFFIAKNDASNVSTKIRLSGAANMEPITLEDLEEKFGQVEAQVMRFTVIKYGKEDREPAGHFCDVTVWTERFVIQIGTDEMVEWLRAIPRHPQYCTL